jgi:hypothetical protein
MAFNMRATNDYANVRAMAYLVNVFPNKDIKDYFNEQGVPTSDDLLAVSTLVQWLWRGCISRMAARGRSLFAVAEDGRRSSGCSRGGLPVGIACAQRGCSIEATCARTLASAGH